MSKKAKTALILILAMLGILLPYIIRISIKINTKWLNTIGLLLGTDNIFVQYLISTVLDIIVTIAIIAAVIFLGDLIHNKFSRRR